MKIAVISSSGGSAFSEALEILRRSGMQSFDFVGISDRACGFEDKCKASGVPLNRIVANTNQEFSRATLDHLQKHGGADVVLLFYARLITKDLFGVIPTVNIHPAKLPDYPGLSAVKRAWNENASQLGATLHWVDESVDEGPRLAQIYRPAEKGATLDRWEKVSFLQKVYLTVLLFDFLDSGALNLSRRELTLTGWPMSKSFGPKLRNPALNREFQCLESRESAMALPRD